MEINNPHDFPSTDDIVADVGDGVWYHGSVAEAHGLYGVTGVHHHPSGDTRYTLAAYDSMDVLQRVRRKSFEVVMPVLPTD